MASKQPPTARARKTTLRPPATSSGRIPATSAGAVAVAPGTGAAAGIGASPQLTLRPPLEAALDAFTRELRAALDKAGADIAALRAEVTQLRQRFESHTHSYEKTAIGGGGHHWIELRFLQGYIDGEHPGHTKYGIWAHGKSTPDGSPTHQTTGPSA